MSAAETSPSATQPLAARLVTDGFYWKTAVVVTALYFLGGRIGLSVPFTRGNVSPLWPPAGIALAAILLCGSRIWPAVAIGAFLVNVLTPIPAYSAAGIAAGNTAGPLVGAWLLRRLAVCDPLKGHPRDVLGLIVLGAFGGTAISATVGTGVLSLTHVAPWSGFRAAWLMWWLGDAMGVLIVAPVALAIPGIRDVVAPRRRVELTALLLATISCSAVVFHAPPEHGSGSVLVAMTFPFLLMWSATRFELVGASLVTACIAVVGVWGTRYGLGPFVGGTWARNAALLQSFLTVIAVSGLSVAALVMERTRLIRQQAEREAVRAGQDRYREIADTANEGIWMLDSRLLTCFVNRRMAQMAGYSPAEMMGKPVVSFMFPEDARQSQARLERRRRGESEQFETRYRRKDGSELWASVSTTGSFDTDGHFTGVLAMVSDITEERRRESERRASRRETLLMTRAVEETADSVVVTDRHGVIKFVNRAFEATTGYLREEAVGRTMAILKSGQHDADFYKALWTELLQGRTFRGTLVNRKKAGELYWAEQTITPIRDDEGEITQFVSVLKDVTELRRKHEQEVQLRLAREVQQRFYAAPMTFPGLELAAASYPANETGGDYFDFIPAAAQSVYIAVGDASGHGLGAALVMALTRAYVRSFAALNLDVGEILTRVNRMLVADLDENRFVTLLLAHVDAGVRVLRYANAGHVPGFIIGGIPGDGVRSTMSSTGPPMGLFADATFPSWELPLALRDAVLLVTDGVTESAGEDDDPFGSERLVAYAGARAEQSARSLARGICDMARDFAGAVPQADDITALVAKITDAPGAFASAPVGETVDAPARSATPLVVH